MRSRLSLAVAALAALTLASCRDDGPTAPAASPTSPIVFVDNFGNSVDFQAFAGSKVDALSIDNVVKHAGSASLKVTVPAPGDAAGGYAGGAFVAGTARDLTGYNALTFWAKASVAATLNVAGLGNDNTGTSLYTAERNAIALTTTWTKYAIAIPLASKLAAEQGLFFFAEGAEGAAGYEIWFDDIKFENLTTVTNVRPALADATVNEEVGGTKTITGTTVTVNVDGVDQTVSAMPAYFTFASSTPSVATVNTSGVISVLATGSTNITATLGTVAATGTVALSATTPPAVAAPTPTRLAADVVSLFSNAYTNATIDTWSASWDQADVSDVTVGGNAAKKYSNLVFAGIEFTSNPVNASAMTHFHIDTWVNSTTAFKVKLVDFGANGVFGGGDDTEHEVTLNAASSPALTAGAWSSLDIPLSAFTGLTGRSKIAQMIISGSSATTYLDNIYFYKVPVPPAPPVAATTPTTPAANVISLFSDAYTNRTVDTWSASWDQADVADTTIAGNAVKKYTNFTFAGIEFTSSTIDASQMTHFRFDYWTPDATTSPADLKVKLVDFGADGAFGGGDDKEHELTFTAATTPGIATGSWVTFDIPLSSFTGLTTTAHLAQLILVSGPNTVYLDNVYFYASTALTAPISAAPTPSYAAGDVISLFSNAYTNRTVDTWSAGWDQADLTDLQVAGNDTKRYTNLTFAGIEFTSSTVDASAMTHFRLDYWSPDSLVGAAFKVKLVDFGADGAFGGGDDKEHELTFTSASTPAITTGSWVTIDIPLSQFTGLTTKGHLAQLIFVGDGPINTVFIDNLLLHK